MSDSYLVEIRLGGAIKDELRNIIEDIAYRFDERELLRSHYVPHITLYGPCEVTDEKVALARIRDICAQYDLVPYRIDDFDHFDRSTIYADIHSSRALRKLRYELSRGLDPLSEYEPTWDHNRWCKFHSTVARNINESFDEIWEYVTSEYAINYEGYAERVSLIRNGNIVKEYSVPQGRFLSSEGATAKPAWERDKTLIERYRQPDAHENLVPSQPGSVQRWRTLLADRFPKTGITRRRNSEFADRPPRVFVSGDLHLNHANIIEYCSRPFKTVHEMNQRLVANWNDTIGPDDTVVFLGDLAFYGDITTYDWLHALNGDLVYIRGNHDDADGIDYEDEYILESETRRYYCTHRPSEIPKDWEGWAIHGHVHNNDVDNHPILDGETQRINAAPELTAYTPVALADIEAGIESPTETCQTSADLRVTDDADRPISNPETGETSARQNWIWLFIAWGWDLYHSLATWLRARTG